jgi:hypothetical protein
MFEPYISSKPYFIGIESGVPTFGVDTLEINLETNEQRVVTTYFSTEAIMSTETEDYMDYLYSYDFDDDAQWYYSEEDEDEEFLDYEDEDPRDLYFD